MIEFFLELGLQVALELIMVWSDDRMWPPQKVSRRTRALALYAPLAFVLGGLSALVVPSPLLVASRNPWLSLLAIPSVTAIFIAYLCKWLGTRGILQSELRNFRVSLIVAFVFAASRYVCLRAG